MNPVAPPAAVLVALLLSCAAPLAEAVQIYKCTATDGSVEFSNLSCPPKTAASIYVTRPDLIEASDARRLMRLDQQSPQVETVPVDVKYTNATWSGDADPNSAERVRVVKELEAQRRALRQRAVPDRKL